jgi:hypothetical protein
MSVFAISCQSTRYPNTTHSRHCAIRLEPMDNPSSQNSLHIAIPLDLSLLRKMPQLVIYRSRARGCKQPLGAGKQAMIPFQKIVQISSSKLGLTWLDLTEEGCLFCPCSSSAVRHCSRKSHNCGGENFDTLNENFLKLSVCEPQSQTISVWRIDSKALKTYSSFCLIVDLIQLSRVRFMFLALRNFTHYTPHIRVNVGG